MAGELRLVCSDALDADSALPGNVFEDLVDQEEGVAMGKNLPDITIYENLRREHPQSQLIRNRNMNELVRLCKMMGK